MDFENGDAMPNGKNHQNESGKSYKFKGLYFN